MKKLLFLSFFILFQKISANEKSYGIYQNKFHLESFFFNTTEPISPYSPSPFTKISKEEIEKCRHLTENPDWCFGNLSLAKEYYDVHNESQLDRNLCFIATNFLGTIIHGDVNQNNLALQLNSFDIRQLLKNGPYKNSVLSIEAQKLIFDSLEKISYVLDIHLHNLGYDEANYLNPKSSCAEDIAPCLEYFKFMALRYASGMTTVIGSTHEARKRIHLYSGHFPKFRGIVLPIHKVYSEDGSVDWLATGSYLKNYSSLLTAGTFYNPYHDSSIYSAISIHPFDPQWKEKMNGAQKRGIYLIKWMPPQGIPTDNPRLWDFYKEMKRLGMVLIAHSGPEHGIPTNESNRIWEDSGNPLRFRKALELGVDVILAHSGHHDLIPDLDDPQRKLVNGSDLFIRLAREAHKKNQTGEWSGKLYGDLAAVTTHYGPEFIAKLLNVANQEGIRLIYGSDYPYTNLVQPGHDAYELCADKGLLDKAMVKPLKEIRNWNPLLANYVFTKNLFLKKETGEILKFPEATFTGNFKDAPLKLISTINGI